MKRSSLLQVIIEHIFFAVPDLRPIVLESDRMLVCDFRRVETGNRINLVDVDRREYEMGRGV
jgi:hypothetical protein